MIHSLGSHRTRYPIDAPFLLVARTILPGLACLPAFHAVQWTRHRARNRPTFTLLNLVFGSFHAEPGLMNRWGSTSLFAVLVLLMGGGLIRSSAARPQAPASSLTAGPKEREAINRFVNVFCVECHNSEDKAGGLDFDAIDGGDLSRNPIVWEKVVRKLVARQMPPDDAIRPSEAHL